MRRLGIRSPWRCEPRSRGLPLPTEIVERVIDAQADALHGERPIDERAMRKRLAASEGGVFRLAARICAGDVADYDSSNREDDARTADLAGLAYGLSAGFCARAPMMPRDC